MAKHATANAVPEALVHRVIVRESRYQPGLVGRGGTIGLMQIKLATARSLGYTGTAEGLRDPETNLTYAVKYLAGAYRAANGDHNRAVAYYASGYYGSPSASGSNMAGIPNRCSPRAPLTRMRSRFPANSRRGRPPQTVCTATLHVCFATRSRRGMPRA